MINVASHLSRRALLRIGAGTAAVAATSMVVADANAFPLEKSPALHQLGELEREHSARLGVYARNTATGKTVLYRADERFPMCSVAKTMAAAAVLRDCDRGGDFLAKRIRYTENDAMESGYAPITGKPENLASGMTVSELCAASISYSDNCAMNLLLQELGGPTAVTRFCRSIGDRISRLDNWCPAHATSEPWKVEDTSSPRAIGRTYEHLVLGNALDPQNREQLTAWLLANTTSEKRFRAGLPTGWVLADKTGTGSGYGTANDVGVTWPPDRAPIVLAVLSTKSRADAPTDEPLVAKTAALLAAALS